MPQKTKQNKKQDKTKHERRKTDHQGWRKLGHTRRAICPHDPGPKAHQGLALEIGEHVWRTGPVSCCKLWVATAIEEEVSGLFGHGAQVTIGQWGTYSLPVLKLCLEREELLNSEASWAFFSWGPLSVTWAQRRDPVGPRYFLTLTSSGLPRKWFQSGTGQLRPWLASPQLWL